MDDLEICKRIAEIEKLNQVEIKGNVLVSHGFSCDRLYNPLKDDALCFQLMIKYAIEVKPPLAGIQVNTKVVWSIFNGVDSFDNYYLYDESTNRAICRAIIEAHKELTNEL
tara:strand:- start:446 stop:778 length:333 start_codon:yes stop_codon:yes gene_type:complete